MSDEKIGIVWNPSKVERAELEAAVEAALDTVAPRPAVEWFETTAEDPGRGATSRAVEAGCALVVAAGGDGTVRAVAERLAGIGGSRAEPGDAAPQQAGASRAEPDAGPARPEGADDPESVGAVARGAELGVVPLGTGNLLARNLGVPLGNPRAAFRLALGGESRALDVGEVSATLASGERIDQGFVVMVGFGIDAQMIAETDDDLKAKAGWLAYVESLGRAAAGTEVVEVELALDDGEPRTVSAHTLLVGNCGTIQGGLTLLPDAVPDDGQLDLLLLRADGVVSWADTVRGFVWENGIKRVFSRRAEATAGATSTDSTDHLRARDVSVSLPTPLAFEIDGDEIGEVTAFEARVHPSALRVRV